jgi:hypothetical protein
MAPRQYHPTSAQHEVEMEVVAVVADERMRIQTWGVAAEHAPILRLAVAEDCGHTPRLDVAAVDCSHRSIRRWDVAVGRIHNLILAVVAAEHFRNLWSGVVAAYDHIPTSGAVAEHGRILRSGTGQDM